MKQKWIPLTIIMALILCGCQSSPKTSPIVSKNDGSFNADIVVSASETHAPDATQSAQHTESFTSTDNSVRFTINIDETISAVDMPVIEVKPHFLTETEARRIGQALFGNSIFYEEDNLTSQEEIQQCISRWTPYTSEEAMKDLLSSSGNAQWSAELLKKNIASYTEKYQTAGVTHAPCAWTFRKDSEYSALSKEDYNPDGIKDNDVIYATVQSGGITYDFRVSIRNEADYKISSLFAFPREYSLFDKAIYIAQLCRTEKPSDIQLENIRKRTEEILAQIDVGDWFIDECYVETTSSQEFIVHVNASPLLGGVPVLRLPQLGNLKSDKAYASNYYRSNIGFRFSPAGDLLYFEMQSPVDVSNIVNENVAVMEIPELLERAKQILELSDCYAYDFDGIVDICREQKVDLGCFVDINSMEYNLIRVKKPNTDEEYYYVPGIVLRGSVEYRNNNTEQILSQQGDVILMALNGVDGTLIQVSNG